MAMDADAVEEQLQRNDAPLHMMAEESWQTDFSEPPQCDIDAAWDREIDRRLEDVLAGRVELIDGDRVRKEARIKLENFRRNREMALA